MRIDKTGHDPVRQGDGGFFDVTDDSVFNVDVAFDDLRTVFAASVKNRPGDDFFIIVGVLPESVFHKIHPYFHFSLFRPVF